MGGKSQQWFSKCLITCLSFHQTESPLKASTVLTASRHSVGVCWVSVPLRIVENSEEKDKVSFRLGPANHTILLKISKNLSLFLESLCHFHSRLP